ncbi:MAG: hypothetical protein HQL93_11855, partial [Magnetococcales bacterium]|nr:hypothetical protein [Magnetococcales bacterium]
MTTTFITQWKRRIKGTLKKYRLTYIRWRNGFGSNELQAALKKLGVHRGDVLLVHSSLDRLEAFTGTITEIITTLQESVGPEG